MGVGEMEASAYGNARVITGEGVEVATVAKQKLGHFALFLLQLQLQLQLQLIKEWSLRDTSRLHLQNINIQYKK